MIFNNTNELRKYITVATTFNFDNFLVYINKAINSYTIKYVGNLHIDLADIESGEDEIKNQAREHLRAAIANFAYFLYTPYAQLTMESSGINMAVSENRKPAEWWQINDIRRELLRSGHESMDLLMEILEDNPDIFTDYATNYASQYKELFIKNATEFSRYYNIFNSRQTFLALLPNLRQVEDQYLKNFITKDFAAELKQLDTSASSTDEQDLKLEVKHYIQKAIVSFTVAKIYNEGFFHFDASGLKLKFDVLPNEKVQAIDYGKPADQLQRAIKIQIDNGTQYILLAKQTMTDNANVFTNALITTSSPTVTTIGSGGIVGI